MRSFPKRAPVSGSNGIDRRRKRPSAWLAVVALTFLYAHPVWGTSYTYVPLVPSATDNTYIAGISGSNTVGDYLSSVDNDEHAFVYNFDTHAYTVVDPVGSVSTYSTGISGNYMAGRWNDGTNDNGYLYNLSSKTYTTINPPNTQGTYITGVSTTYVVGSYYGGGTLQGFVYNIGTKAYTTINPSGSSATNVMGISGNNVTGIYFDGNNNAGFVYNISTRAFTTFDLNPGYDTHVTGISGNTVVGYYYAVSGNTGFIYNLSTQTTTLYDPSNGRGTYINSVSGNSVVGSYFDGEENVGFIYNFSTTAYTELDPDPNGTDFNPTGVAGTSVVGEDTGSDGNSHGFLGFVANATITLTGNLNVNYDGTTKGLTATTSPTGLVVTTTYQPVDGSGIPLGAPTTTAPSNAGNYAVVATVDDGTHLAMNTATLVIHTLPVTVTVQSQDSPGPNYDGTPKSLTASTNPSGVAFTLHYTGSSNTHGTYPNPAFGETDGPPTNAGFYTGTAVINDPNYTLANPTTAFGQLSINSAPQPIDLSYLGTVTVNDVFDLPETTAAGNVITYFFLDSSNDQVTSTEYATLTQGSDGVTDNVLTIIKKGPITLYASAPGDVNHLMADPPGQSLDVDLDTAGITVNKVSIAYDGSAHPANAITNPSYLSADGDVSFTYTDSQGHVSSSAPVAVGQYTVAATISDPDDVWQGTASGTMIIGQSQTFAAWQTAHFTSTNPSIIGAAATPEHDGVSNAMKYLSNIDPSEAMSAADRAALPTLGMDSTIAANTDYLTLTYRQFSLMSGGTIHVQASSDLITWRTLSTSDSPSDMISRQIGNDATTGDPLVEVGVKLTGTAYKFIRLDFSP